MVDCCCSFAACYYGSCSGTVAAWKVEKQVDLHATDLTDVEALVEGAVVD